MLGEGRPGELNRMATHEVRDITILGAGPAGLFALFYESIVNDGPPPISYRDMLRIAAWMDEIFRQAPQQQGRPA